MEIRNGTEPGGIKGAHTKEQKVMLLGEVRFIFPALLQCFSRANLGYIFDLTS